MKKATFIILSFVLLSAAACYDRGENAPAPAQKPKSARAAIAPAPSEDKPLDRLSSLLRKGSHKGTLTESERRELERLLPLILPESDYIGADREWEVAYHDLPDNDFFQVDLKKKGGDSFDRDMWFHILYLREKPEFYGSDEFEGFQGMGMENVHYFILVGRMEIRAVASSEAFKKDEKIMGMLKAFKLSEISEL